MEQEGSVSGPGEITEVVGRFAGRAEFTTAVEELLGAGFAPSDLSVLDTHEALGASLGAQLGGHCDSLVPACLERAGLC